RHLPLFNSHSIAMFLHEIPGLAEQYLYFNDDVFAAYFLRPQDFFYPLRGLRQIDQADHLKLTPPSGDRAGNRRSASRWPRAERQSRLWPRSSGSDAGDAPFLPGLAVRAPPKNGSV